jgi:hypothetical protein
METTGEEGHLNNTDCVLEEKTRKKRRPKRTKKKNQVEDRSCCYQQWARRREEGECAIREGSSRRNQGYG